MGQFLQALFGGSTTTQTPKDVTPAELAGLRGPFADALKGLFGTGTGGGISGIPSFTGTTGQPLSAPIAAGEQQALDVLSADLAPGNARRGLIEQTLAGQFLPGSPGANPFLQATIEAAQRPTLQGLEETLSRVLPGRFTQGGQFTQPQSSSAFDRAAAIATRGVAQTLGDIASQISFGTQEAERGRQQQAVQLSQQDVQTTVSNLQAQGLPRLIEDLGIERGLEEFKNRIAAVLQALSVATGAPLVTVANQGQSTTQGGIIPGLFAQGVYQPRV